MVGESRGDDSRARAALEICGAEGSADFEIELEEVPPVVVDSLDDDLLTAFVGFVDIKFLPVVIPGRCNVGIFDVIDFVFQKFIAES